MRQDIVLFGAGGLAREVNYWIQRDLADKFNVIGFVVDDKYYDSLHPTVNGLPLYKKDYLLKSSQQLGVVISLSNVYGKRRIFEELSPIPNLSFPSIILPSAKVADDVEIGEGSIIIDNCLVSVNVTIGRCVLLNGYVTVGHDAVIGDFSSLMPKSSISGNVRTGSNCYLGSGCFVMEKKHIGNNSVVAAGGIVFTDVPDHVTVMGNPATVLMHHK